MTEKEVIAAITVHAIVILDENIVLQIATDIQDMSVIVLDLLIVTAIITTVLAIVKIAFRTIVIIVAIVDVLIQLVLQDVVDILVAGINEITMLEE